MTAFASDSRLAATDLGFAAQVRGIHILEHLQDIAVPAFEGCQLGVGQAHPLRHRTRPVPGVPGYREPQLNLLQPGQRISCRGRTAPVQLSPQQLQGGPFIQCQSVTGPLFNVGQDPAGRFVIVQGDKSPGRFDGHVRQLLPSGDFPGKPQGRLRIGELVREAGSRQGQTGIHFFTAVECPGDRSGPGVFVKVLVLEHSTQPAAKFRTASGRHYAGDDSRGDRVGDAHHGRMVMADPDQCPFLKGVDVLRLRHVHQGLQGQGPSERQDLKDITLARTEPVQAGFEHIPDLAGQRHRPVPQYPRILVANNDSQLDLFPGQGVQEERIAAAGVPEGACRGVGEVSTVLLGEAVHRFAEIERAKIHPAQQVILPEPHDVAAQVGQVNARGEQQDVAAGAELGHHHGGQFIEVMGIVDKKYDAAALGTGMEQLGQATQNHQRVLEVGGIKFVKKYAQRTVRQLGGNGTAPDLDHQEVITRAVQGPAGQ